MNLKCLYSNKICNNYITIIVKGIGAGSQLQCQLSLIIALAGSQPINNY